MHFPKPIPIALASAIVLLGAGSLRSEMPSVDFNRDVRPILSDKCFFCHGPDPETREAGLRLDIREDAVEFGAFEPGDAAGSELATRIASDDPDAVMPPPSSHKSLSEVEKQTLIRWIDQGAIYQQHWAFTTPVQPPVPAADPASWIANPIDAFILQQLNAQDVEPSAPASRDRLIRRLTLDLLGLPPIESITGIATEGEYDDYVERCLTSVHHAERMAADWLDVVRYADTVGFHGDQNQNIFPYRDWVIDSIARNEPFDIFTTKQLAGDLMPDAGVDDRIASGFNRLNMMTREGGAQPGEYLAKYAADRVRTVGMAWMGLTTGCAECHDHKFDPFKAKDFYSLAAYFDDVKQYGVYSDYGYTPNPELRGGSNDYPFYPEMEVFSQPLLQRQQRLETDLADVAKAWIDQSCQTDQFESYTEEINGFSDGVQDGWSCAAEKTFADDGDSDQTLDIVLGNQTIRSIRFELVATPESEGSVLRDRAATAHLKFACSIRGTDGKNRPVKIRRSDANRRHPDYSSTQPVLDVTSQWKIPRQHPDGTVHEILDLQHHADPSNTDEPLAAVFQFAEPVTLSKGEALIVNIEGGKLARVTAAVSPKWWLQPFAASAPDHVDHDLIAWAMANADGDAASTMGVLEQEFRRCNDGYTMTMVSQATEPKTSRILHRGNWQDESGEVVMPHPPAFIGMFEPTDSDRRQTRLDLAQWLTHPENPLTARVVVNRYWKHFFGSGLSETADDFGAQGEPPSHLQLLDWLATEFVRSGWDRRHIIRLIVTSNTYKQDSRVRPELLERDPNNRWLSYHPPRRLEAEAIRDIALASGNLLNLDVGGPAIYPYQPVGYYANLQFPDRNYVASSGADQYRRGLYMHWQRAYLHPMLANFDAPSREDCVAMRSVANTPQQALTLLNDPTFVEAARGLAVRVLSDPGDDQTRLGVMFSRSLQREASEYEIQSLTSFLNQQREIYATDPAAADELLVVGQTLAAEIIEQIEMGPGHPHSKAVELAAWTAAARVLLNTHEFITRY